MASLVPLIEKQIRAEAEKRGFLKTRYQYYVHINTLFDGVFHFLISTYKHIRVVDVRLALTHLEQERLYAILCDKTPPFYFRKKAVRLFSDSKSLISLISPDEKPQHHWGFEYYEEYQDMMKDTTQKMFSLIDKYAFDYFKEMADVDKIVYSCLNTKGHFRQVNFTNIPLLYLASGRREDAIHYLENELNEPMFQRKQFWDFYHDLVNYDYDADPEKFPVE